MSLPVVDLIILGVFTLVVVLWSSSCFNDLTEWPSMANACKCFDMFAVWSAPVVSCDSNVWWKAQPCHCGGCLRNIVPSFCVTLLSSQNPPIDFQCVLGVGHDFQSRSEGSTPPSLTRFLHQSPPAPLPPLSFTAAARNVWTLSLSHLCTVSSVCLSVCPSVNSVPPDQQQGQCGHQPQRACSHSFSGTLSACTAAWTPAWLSVSVLTACLLLLPVASAYSLCFLGSYHSLCGHRLFPTRLRWISLLLTVTDSMIFLVVDDGSELLVVLGIHKLEEKI